MRASRPYVTLAQRAWRRQRELPKVSQVLILSRVCGALPVYREPSRRVSSISRDFYETSESIESSQYARNSVQGISVIYAMSTESFKSSQQEAREGSLVTFSETERFARVVSTIGIILYALGENHIKVQTRHLKSVTHLKRA